jgi:hypothetical protein
MVEVGKGPRGQVVFSAHVSYRKYAKDSVLHVVIVNTLLQSRGPSRRAGRNYPHLTKLKFLLLRTKPWMRFGRHLKMCRVVLVNIHDGLHPFSN